ncbi:hypothetical protein Tco_1139282, partial [Tanacetum coccineum]
AKQQLTTCAPIYYREMTRTDEDAFKVLREGNRGYGILVSFLLPKESQKAFLLSSFLREYFRAKDFSLNLYSYIGKKFLMP